MSVQTNQTPPPQPAVPPEGPTPKKKVGIALVVGAVLIILVSLLFSNTAPLPRNAKLYTGKQQPVSPDDVNAFQNSAQAEAERARQQRALEDARRRVEQALQHGNDGAANTNLPCQYTKEGCYGQTPSTASAADTAAAERKAKRERQLHASSLALDLSTPDSIVKSSANGVANPTTPAAAPSLSTEKPVQTSEIRTVADKPTDMASYDKWGGKLYRLLEGTYLEVVVKDRINGDAAGPVEAMLSNDVYSLNNQHLLLPKGTVLVGEARAVGGQFQQRLFVAFHRLICPDGFSINLDQFRGLSQQGDVGLQDQVNHHYLSIFGTAIALAAIGGVANINNGSTGFSYDPSVEFRSGIASQMSQAADRVLDRYLNRLPTLVIRPGARSRIFVSQDLLVPAYAEHRVDPAL
jgi:type IV secretion system protein TrbI